jgi:thiol-disulfide isomerase/thioredoxin
VKYLRGNWLTIFIIILVILAVASYVYYLKNQTHIAENPATKALVADIEQAPYTNLAGEEARLDQYFGEVLVINSWASWSPYSATELPALARVSETYGAQGVKVIAINRAEAKTTAESFLNTLGVAEELELILDPDDRYYKSLSGYAMPQTIFYDRAGNIVHHQHGVMKEVDIKKYIELALDSERE